MNKDILITGATTNNLKNVDVRIPKNKLTVITGLSGSGKSSLAFHTLYAEGQRRFLESLPTYARQFINQLPRPDVEHIVGLSPTITVSQNTRIANPMSTVGSITELDQYLRLLFSKIGQQRCPIHHKNLTQKTKEEHVSTILSLPQGSKVMLLSPIKISSAEDLDEKIKQFSIQGFVRAKINNTLYELQSSHKIKKKKQNTFELVVDRFKVNPSNKLRLSESLETCFELSAGIAKLQFINDTEQSDLVLSNKLSCPECDYEAAQLPATAEQQTLLDKVCPVCKGLGAQQLIDPDLVVENLNLSVADGAIKGWDSSKLFHFPMLEKVAKFYKFSLHVPFSEMAKQHQDIILNGSGEDYIPFKFFIGGKIVDKPKPFEGVIGDMERRYKQTKSSNVRAEIESYFSKQSCPACNGSKLHESTAFSYIGDHTLATLFRLPIDEVHRYFNTLTLSKKHYDTAKKIIAEIDKRLNCLKKIGLGYLDLSRQASTLSGGELQRTRLASQVVAGLIGITYILDEPTAGLHQKDVQNLLSLLFDIKNAGNTVIIVEHDETIIRNADYIIDLGPGAGYLGGQVIAQGNLTQVMKNDASITGAFLNRTESRISQSANTIDTPHWMTLEGATGNNLNDVELRIPLGCLTAITGVSGSGKSTLITETLYPALQNKVSATENLEAQPFRNLKDFEHIKNVVLVDQKPIGRSPKSTPATYTGIFDVIRQVFSQTKKARRCGYTAKHFSLNSKGGRCEQCKGHGKIKVDMQFLPDTYVTCDECNGLRYDQQTLEVKYQGLSISEVLELDIAESMSFFSSSESIKYKLQSLIDVGLSYIKLGQAATTFSGGEAQRIKLSKALSANRNGTTLYILDEPTSGLHFSDTQMLLSVLKRLQNEGNSLVIVEHNMEVIKSADWVIDLGPEGGKNGGRIIASGTPLDLIENAHSITGKSLKTSALMNISQIIK
ncbi:excinuclease ABC subunit A [Pseudoalteromonas luteoviolacea]|nr:excinuclease ABC subunit A [Pseudoalteromonas luteoviolacea]